MNPSCLFQGGLAAEVVAVQVAQQRDLGAVMHHLAADVEDELGIGPFGVGPLGRPDRAPSPKWLSARKPNTPLPMCPSRQPMVVKGVGIGSGYSKSITRSPFPAAILLTAVARDRMLQHPGTGSQK